VIKFAVTTTRSQNNLVMLTAFRMVNIFPVSLRRTKQSYPWGHMNCYTGISGGVSCTRPPYSNDYMFSIRKMCSLTVMMFMMIMQYGTSFARIILRYRVVVRVSAAKDKLVRMTFSQNVAKKNHSNSFSNRRHSNDANVNIGSSFDVLRQ
jgi:hypothetical protein